MDRYVFIDTNVLVYCVKNRVDIMREIKRLKEPYKPAIIPQVAEELRHVSGHLNEPGFMESLVGSIPRIQAEGKGDDAIVAAAIATHSAVLTNDRELRARLKENGIRVFAFRQGRRVEAV